MRGMPLWLFSMRVRQLIVHPKEIRIPRNGSWPAAIGFGIVMDAWRYAWCAPSNPPLNSWTVTSVLLSNGMPRSCR